MSEFIVILNDEIIDTVFYNGYTALEVKESLIDHDGYDSNIHVLEDSEVTRELDELDNHDKHVIANCEHHYTKAIETGFMCEETLETFGRFL